MRYQIRQARLGVLPKRDKGVQKNGKKYFLNTPAKHRMSSYKLLTFSQHIRHKALFVNDRAQMCTFADFVLAVPGFD